MEGFDADPRIAALERRVTGLETGIADVAAAVRENGEAIEDLAGSLRKSAEFDRDMIARMLPPVSAARAPAPLISIGPPKAAREKVRQWLAFAILAAAGAGATALAQALTSCGQ